jgi:glycosyltransferase involved in cell wall biosynthesis
MGGAEVYTHEVAKRWVMAGHKVVLFTSEFSNCKKEEVIDGIKIIRAGGKYSVYWKAMESYREHLSKESYDIVIDEINTRPFFTPKFVNKGEKIIALIFQLAREYWFYETPFPISYIGYHFLENRWLKNYIDIPTVTISKSTKEDLINLGYKEVFIVPSGINFKPLAKVPEKDKNPIIVYVGRLNRAKRPDHLINAFKIVKEDVPEAELWLIGNGDFRRDLEKIAYKGVKFFPGLSNENRRELIKRAWVLVNPSVREGFGLNIIEANALGVPCIAYNVHGLCDSIQNKETGLLVDSGKVQNLAEKIINILKDTELREKLSENSLGYARYFCWENSAEEFLKIIRTIYEK